MGRVKEDYYEQVDRGYFNIDDKNVCADCFYDYSIINFIKDNAGHKKCDYCGSISEVPIAAEMNDVLAIIMEGIFSEWGDPSDEGIGWESSEGGWQGEVLDSYDLIYDEEIIPTSNNKILEDILESIQERQWCKRNYYGLRTENILISSWSYFSKLVKHKMRYVFFRSNEKKDELYEESIPPSIML
ncbi:MAG: hypothetical protein JXA07_01300, partial [Spirochaetes bacterium]|nr:hypothetical protein [Spirochaetota bacterium]